MLAQEARNFPRLGVAAQGFFAENEGVAGLDFKAPAAGGQQREAPDLREKFCKQFCRQTDGAWCIVSLDAKFNAEGVLVHTSLLQMSGAQEQPARRRR